MSVPQAKTRVKAPVVSGFRRVLELLFLLISTLAAFFFFKEAEKSHAENHQLHAELRRLKKRRSDDGSGICSICLEDPLEVLFNPCGHIATCQRCAHQCQSCPICRSRIESTKKVFLASWERYMNGCNDFDSWRARYDMNWDIFGAVRWTSPSEHLKGGSYTCGDTPSAKHKRKWVNPTLSYFYSCFLRLGAPGEDILLNG